MPSTEATPSDSGVEAQGDAASVVDKPSRRVIFRDLMIFQFKLWLDGLKDIVLSPLSILGFLLDLVFGSRMTGSVFYKVLKIGERYDLWLNLFGAAEKAEHSRQGFLDPRVEDDRASLDDILRRHTPGPTPADSVAVEEVKPEMNFEVRRDPQPPKQRR